jgi:hypothetical protein
LERYIILCSSLGQAVGDSLETGTAIKKVSIEGKETDMSGPNTEPLEKFKKERERVVREWMGVK